MTFRSFASWARLTAGLTLLVACGDAGPATGEADARPVAQLRADGTDIVDGSGKVVLLRGANLGSWMFHETWISAVDYPTYGRVHVLGAEAGLGEQVDLALQAVGPGDGADWLAKLEVELESRLGQPSTDDLLAELERFPSIYDDSDLPLRLELEERFGVEGRDELLGVFQDAWIRESDIAWLAAQGFNLVRVPMGYRSLVRNSDAAPLESLDYNEQAFVRLGRLLDWCETHGVYAVLDLQESPGGHNDYSGPARLYEDLEMQALTVQLWEEIARRFGDRTIVAAYSLLAEPFDAPSQDARDEMYDRLVKAIRALGDQHLLVIHDGFDGMVSLPRPEEYGWTDVVYSTHLFEWDLDSAEEYQARIRVLETLFRAAQDRQRVPYFVGSFSTMVDAAWAYDSARRLVELYERNGWSWSLWTLKRIDDPIGVALYGERTSWGLLGRLEGQIDRPDVQRDDEQALRDALSSYAGLDLRPNQALLDALRAPWE